MMNITSRTRTVASAAILVAAVVLVIVVCSGMPIVKSTECPEGIIIDFEEYDTVWTEFPLDGISAVDALERACAKNSFSLTVDADGNVTEINGVCNTAEEAWGFWTVEKGSTSWKKIDRPYDCGAKGHSAACWAYRGENAGPTVAVDLNGKSIYGLGNVSRTVTLSSIITEDMCSVGGIDTIIGTDLYSDYPESIVERQESGTIAIVGDYTTPNFEEIVKRNPDAVFCDSSIHNHKQVCQRLNDSGIDAMLMYDATSIDTIKDNIFILAKTIGHSDEAKAIFSYYDEATEKMSEILRASPETKVRNVAFTLSGGMSPWVAGSDTYIDSIASTVYGKNVFCDLTGWSSINSEQMLKGNPSKIIVMLDDGTASKEYYDSFISSLPDEWKGTDAYKNGDIYILCGEASKLGQRAGPRYIQLTELVGRILNPKVFDDIEISRYIGDDYRDYLSYTKELAIE